jgi:cell cycle checkpoint protein
MIEVEGAALTSQAGTGGAAGGKVSFVDFRFVPLVEEDDDEAEGGDIDETIMHNGTGSDGESGDRHMLS